VQLTRSCNKLQFWGSQVKSLVESRLALGFLSRIGEDFCTFFEGQLPKTSGFGPKPEFANDYPLCFMLFVAASQLLVARDDISFLIIPSSIADVTHELHVL